MAEAAASRIFSAGLMINYFSIKRQLKTPKSSTHTHRQRERETAGEIEIKYKTDRQTDAEREGGQATAGRWLIKKTLKWANVAMRINRVRL